MVADTQFGDVPEPSDYETRQFSHVETLKLSQVWCTHIEVLMHLVHELVLGIGQRSHQVTESSLAKILQSENLQTYALVLPSVP